jgi:hypothetical protein
MNKYETKDNKFKLFKNNRKTQDNHPDLTGEIRIGGKLYYFDAYVNKSEAGNTWFSGSIGNPKEEAPGMGAPQVQSEPKYKDIPFD